LLTCVACRMYKLIDRVCDMLNYFRSHNAIGK